MTVKENWEHKRVLSSHATGNIYETLQQINGLPASQSQSKLQVHHFIQELLKTLHLNSIL